MHAAASTSIIVTNYQFFMVFGIITRSGQTLVKNAKTTGFLGGLLMAFLRKEKSNLFVLQRL